MKKSAIVSARGSTHPQRDRGLHMLAEGKRPGEVAAELGIAPTTVWSWPKRHAPEIEAIRAQLAQGKPKEVPAAAPEPVISPPAPATPPAPAASSAPPAAPPQEDTTSKTKGKADYMLHLRGDATAEIIGQIERLAEESGDPSSQIGRKLLSIGLAAVLKDPSLMYRAAQVLREALASARGEG